MDENHDGIEEEESMVYDDDPSECIKDEKT
jgi:hypothetical protein